jgi:cytochrome c oxidase subunit 2
MVQQGQQLFTQLACVTCHLPDGSGRGPSLVGVFGSTVTLDNGTKVVADETYLRESILTSQAKTVAGYQQLMPTFQGLVNEDGLASLIEYIKSMQSGGARVASTQAP